MSVSVAPSTQIVTQERPLSSLIAKPFLIAVAIYIQEHYVVGIAYYLFIDYNRIDRANEDTKTIGISYITTPRPGRQTPAAARPSPGLSGRVPRQTNRPCPALVTPAPGPTGPPSLGAEATAVHLVLDAM